MEAVAEIEFDGGRGDSRGWAVGFMQALHFVDWAIYRGASEADGSILRQRGRMPADMATTCWDAEKPGTPFVFPTSIPQKTWDGSKKLPLFVELPSDPPPKVRVMIQDAPNSGYRYGLENRRTKKLNLIQEALFRLELCAVLALRDPGGRVRVLGGVLWSVAWHTKFKLDPTTVTLPATALPGTRAVIGSVFSGPPKDPRFANMFGQRHSTTCNVEMARVFDQEMTNWPEFNVVR